MRERKHKHMPTYSVRHCRLLIMSIWDNHVYGRRAKYPRAHPLPPILKLTSNLAKTLPMSCRVFCDLGAFRARVLVAEHGMSLLSDYALCRADTIQYSYMSLRGGMIAVCLFFLGRSCLWLLCSFAFGLACGWTFFALFIWLWRVMCRTQPALSIPVHISQLVWAFLRL